MNKIKLLPQKLINKIAAGEVIERPASIVKELIENSIDANADEIEIIIEGGGIKSICIHDNGVGMSPDDAEKSYILHATSKISSLEDLNAIFTLGFRGEALASIAAVSELIIHTKTSNTKGIKITIENSIQKDKRFLERSVGTTIVVQDIFRHLPARKKFLKTENTEYRHILNEVTKFALIYSNIAFKLIHNDKVIFNLKKTNTVNERILQIYPDFSNDLLINFEYKDQDFDIQAKLIHPKATNSNRFREFLYINRRFVFERSLAKAIKEGYSTSIPKENFPAYILNINIDPARIDVNIHPKKLEVKIENVSRLFQILKKGIQTILNQTLKDELDKKIGGSRILENQDISKIKSSPLAFTHNKYKKVTVLKIRNLSTTKNTSGNNIQQSMTFTKALLAESIPQTIFAYKYFQVFNTYIIIEKEDELQIIDQHAADERINYERIIEKIQNKELVAKQDLLLPITIKLSTEDLETLKPYLTRISSFGLDIDVFGTNSIKINSMPQFSRNTDYQELIYELITIIKSNTQEINIDQLNHKIASSIACHASIRAGKKLSMEEIFKLIEDLFSCTQPYSCPHGRPIIWTLSKKELEKQFKRIK